MAKKPSPNYSVSPTEDRRWSVKRDGADRAVYVFDTQVQANERARALAMEACGERITQGRHGSMVRDDTYSDESSRRGREH